MKKLVLIMLVAVAVINCAIVGFAADSSSTKAIAYYFHGSFRCPTCHKLEQYSKEAIEINFKDALASGKLELKTVNVEEKGNEHFVNDYKLYTKSLIISLVKDGKEVKSKNLDKIWELVNNKQKFIDYVTLEVTEFMKDVK